MSSSASRNAVCLWLPTFALRMELVRTPDLDSTSVALLASGEKGVRGEIHEVSERAGEAGVRPGMRVSQALALCPSLLLLEPDPAHYAAATAQIIEALEEVSPVVQAGEPGVIHIGTDGLDRLYGPPKAQLDRIFQVLMGLLPHPLVAAMRAGAAPGIFGSRVAAHSAHPGEPVLVAEEELPIFLARQPIEVLPVPDEMLDRLRRLGILTLGALRELSLPALLRHFGREGREAWELASGERIEPVRSRRRPRPIRISMDLPSPLGSREALEHGVKRMLERGIARPERRGRSILSLRAGGELEGGSSWHVEATLRHPTTGVRELASALESRISLAPPPRALLTLFVEFVEFGAPSFQEGLFAPGEGGEKNREDSPLLRREVARALREAIRDLRLRIGHAPLYRVVEVDPRSRIPERRHALLPLDL